jgi:hypothetical protein
MKEYKIQLNTSNNSTIESATTIQVPTKTSELVHDQLRVIHYISAYNLNSASSSSFYFEGLFINNSNVQIKNLSLLIQALQDAHLTSDIYCLPVSGTVYTSTHGQCTIVGIYASNSTTLGVKYTRLNNSKITTSTTTFTSVSVSDTTYIYNLRW